MARKNLKHTSRLVAEVLPASHGYRMPAEWENHASTWVAWPHRRADWPGKLSTIPWVYGEIIRWLTLSERVNIFVNDAKTESHAEAMLKQIGVNIKQVQFWRLRTDRVWTRDYGPMFVLGPENQKAVIDWRFNGWAKYPNSKNDDAIAGSIAKQCDYSSWQPTCDGTRVVLEGVRH